jgi:hypothetical protein
LSKVEGSVNNRLLQEENTNQCSMLLELDSKNSRERQATDYETNGQNIWLWSNSNLAKWVAGHIQCD